MRTGIRQSQSRTPRATNHQPLVNLQLQSQSLDVLNQGLRVIAGQWMVCRASSTSTLVEQHHMCVGRIEELPVLGRATTAWPTMQKHHGQATEVATLLKINSVAVRRG
jgi:hypothetical protein